ncbi:hypothetical protein MPK64_gp154 [Erwinia phage pEa_SNUABM_16]|uniref:Uncharacterized protein n=1 Tax=Erwinia phage pEa_SNUABM_16 TaxID=2869544 RepID=A0AAE8XU12_9CAUD|nr:hypothetical protein MPK64_gp154 [Erwinia phage pEa_SNUABM_16]QZE59057.1 hypothetical protein pEaSNUABM18_00154 [Erwinia phage pEa_SNUABM_18]UAW96298.1 hypothetical protein pEaSNUABM16_00154 [Erwinia phage pEa_SNUABM_16]
MAEMIPVVSATGAQSWSGTVSVNGHTDALKFRVVGGTFADASTEKDITPSSGSDYDVSLIANVTVSAAATQPVVLYYLDGDTWVLVHSLSRIFVRPQTKELDYRLVTQGMDAMPLGGALNPTYGGLVLGGGVRIPTTQDMQQSSVAKFSDFEGTFFDLTKPISIVYDRQGRRLYYLHTDGDASNTKVFGSMDDVDIAGYKVSYDTNNKRSAVVFHTSGQVDVLDEAMTQFGEPKQLGYEVNRVICRRAGVGTNTVDSYVAFDKDGRAHYLNASFVETSVKSDQFYVNGSDSYDVLSTLDGKLVGGNTAAAPASVFWYQFVPSSLLVLGHDGTNIYQFNLRDNVQNVAARPLVANDLVVFNTTAAWTDKGGKLVSGMDTNGSNALFNFASAETPTQTRSGWPYIELITPPYTQADTYDRLFYYVARPTTGLKHLAIRNYDIVWPDLSSVQLGPTVKFKVLVDAGDPDIPLPITAPAGVTVAATIDVTTTDIVDGKEVTTVTTVPVTKVYDGQEVTITLSHEYITSSSFPITIGHTVYQFEMKADDTPNAFSWQNIVGVDNDTWNRTEDVAITGINVSVPVKVFVDGVEDYDRVKIFVNGVETAMPVLIRNNQTLGFEILHENDTSRIDVDVGQGTSRFSVFTIVEAQLDVGRHWAYVPVGKEVQSDVMKNTGTIPLVLTITDTDAVFPNGTQTITLAVGATTSIKFTPKENKQYAVKFHSDQFTYEWYVWADRQWLGTTPAAKRAERYVMGDSGTFFIDNIPDNFWTYFTIPAGMLLDIDGVRVEQELDSRGVYKEQGLVVGPFECADTMLKIYGLPSQNQPHSLKFGDASVGWLYNMTVDPTYAAYGTDSVQLFGVSYLDATTDAVSVFDAKTYVAASDQNIVLTPVYDPELDVQLQWLDFEDAAAHAVVAADRVIATGDRDVVQVIKGNDFDTGHKDFVDNFRMADLIDRSDIIYDRFPLFELTEAPALASDNFPLFELTEGQKDVVVTTPLPAFIGTNEGAATATFPLFELTQGQVDTATDFPLFEATVGDDVVSDWFWPTFATDVATVNDTFINNFVEHMDDAPQYFDLRGPVYRTGVKTKSDQILPRFSDTKGIYPVEALEVKKVDAGGLFQQGMTEPRQANLGGLFHPDAFGPQYIEPSAVYHVGWARPLWRPAYVTYKAKTMTAKYVDPDYHPAVLFMPEIPFTRWLKPSQIYHYDPATPVRMEHIVKYPVSPAAGEFEQLKLIAAPVDVAKPSAKDAPTVYLHLIEGKFIQSAPRIDTDVLEPDLIKAPRIIPVARTPGAPATRPPISVEIRTSRKADNNKSYAVVAPVVEAWTVEPNHGSIDKPLEEGYFETELLALQNATQVWGFDPSVVYAIQQPNGYWTWAQITVCEESCGSMSCAARGYLSGG